MPSSIVLSSDTDEENPIHRAPSRPSLRHRRPPPVYADYGKPEPLILDSDEEEDEAQIYDTPPIPPDEPCPSTSAAEPIEPDVKPTVTTRARLSLNVPGSRKSAAGTSAPSNKPSRLAKAGKATTSQAQAQQRQKQVQARRAEWQGVARPDKEVEAVAAAVNEKRKRKKTDVPLDDLQYPMSIKVSLEELVVDRSRLPPNASLRYSLAYRLPEQAALNATVVGTRTWQIVVPASASPDNRIVAIPFSSLPRPHSFSVIKPPHRSGIAGILLSVSVVDAASTLCVGHASLTSHGPKLIRSGEKVVELKPPPDAASTSHDEHEPVSVAISWEAVLPQEKEKEKIEMQEPKEPTDEEIRAILEEELRKLEMEWRIDVAEREEASLLGTCARVACTISLTFSILLCCFWQARNRRIATYVPPQPVINVDGNAPRPSSLIPGLSDSEPDVDPADTVAEYRFAPVPRYTHVEFVLVGKPDDEGPLNTFPFFPETWEDAKAANAAVEHEVTRVLEPWKVANEGVPLEDRMSRADLKEWREEEGEWRQSKLVDHEAFNAPDPGRVWRDYHALSALFKHLKLSSADLQKLEDDAVTKAKEANEHDDDPSVFTVQTHGDLSSTAVMALKAFEVRTGVSARFVQKRYLQDHDVEPLINKSSQLGPCHFCAVYLCTVHGDPAHAHAAHNVPTYRPERPQRLRTGAPDEYPLSRRNQSLEAQLTADGMPDMTPCLASLIFERPVWEGEFENVYFPTQHAEPNYRERNSLTRPQIKGDYVPLDSLGYEPCDCEGSCGDDCFCVGHDTFCDRFCGCPPACSRRFPGCDDTACQRRSCVCSEFFRECDPQLCGCNPAHCHNSQIRLQQQKQTQLVKSGLEGGGFGIIVLEPVEADDLLGLYGGEYFMTNIGADASQVGGAWKDILKGTEASYFFNVEERRDEATTFAIDSEKFGSTMRYINASETPKKINCEPRVTYVAGTHQIAMYATQRIAPGGEVVFNYGEGYYHADYKDWVGKAKKEERVVA
ncbi:hypothetical protein JCM11641_005727 [Rhodosporidiobolus odoratus]